MRTKRLQPAALLTFALLLAGCDGSDIVTTLRSPGSKDLAIGAAASSSAPAVAVAPGSSGAKGIVVQAVNGIHGIVLGLDGQPAKDIPVHGLISNNASNLIGNNSAGLIGNNSASLISNNAASYRVQSLDTRTDANGQYTLEAPDGQNLTVEAVLSDDVKALSLDATSSTSTDLQLAYTGRIKGQILPPQASVTDLLGVDVFIPGTSYVAKTDGQGNFDLPYVPVGTFSLVANHPDLGRAIVNGVEVKAKLITTLSAFPLSTTLPTLTSITPTNGAPGQTVTLAGDHFGISSGKHPEVLLNGLTAQVVSSTDKELKAVIPNGVVSGDIRVRVSGLESATRSFQVLSQLAIFPESMAAQAATAAGIPPLHDVLAMGVNRKYLVRAFDTSNQLVTQPAVVWSQVYSGLGTLQDGLLTPAAPCTLAISVFAGSLAPPPPLMVEIIPAIASLQITPSTVPALNPRPVGVTLTAAELAAIADTVQLSAWAVHADGSTRSVPITWSTVSPGITVSSTGLVQAVAGADEGQAIVTVTTSADPSQSAQITIPLVHQGGLAFEID